MAVCRFQQDTLLGVASIPLSPLLQESWVQGTAPVLAVMTKADSQLQDRVQVTRPYVHESNVQQFGHEEKPKPVTSSAIVQ